MISSALPTHALADAGARRAGLPFTLASFFVAWGFCGYWAQRLLLEGSDGAAPALRQMLPTLGIALLGGLLGSWAAAAVMRRALPRDESAIVGRDELLGSVGCIAFSASEGGGRIHVYDDHGTLHDETCRVAAGRPPIAKGRYALIVDVDSDGRFLVEETTAPAA